MTLYLLGLIGFFLFASSAAYFAIAHIATRRAKRARVRTRAHRATRG